MCASPARGTPSSSSTSHVPCALSSLAWARRASESTVHWRHAVSSVLQRSIRGQGTGSGQAVYRKVLRRADQKAQERPQRPEPVPKQVCVKQCTIHAPIEGCACGVPALLAAECGAPNVFARAAESVGVALVGGWLAALGRGAEPLGGRRPKARVHLLARRFLLRPRRAVALVT